MNYGSGTATGQMPIGTRAPFSMDDAIRVESSALPQTHAMASAANVSGLSGPGNIGCQPQPNIRMPGPGLRQIPVPSTIQGGTNPLPGPPVAGPGTGQATTITHPANRLTDDGEKSDDQLEDLFACELLENALENSIFCFVV